MLTKYQIYNIKIIKIYICNAFIGIYLSHLFTSVTITKYQRLVNIYIYKPTEGWS